MTNSTDTTIVQLFDLLTSERNIRSITEESLMLCRETIENAIPGTSEQWLPIYKQHTEGLLFMVNQELKIVGLCEFFALSKILIHRIIQGKIEDEQITLDEVVPMKTQGIYDVYVTFFGVKKEYRCLKSNRMLYLALIKRFTKLAEAGIVIGNAYTQIVTPAGASLSKMWGFRYLTPHYRRGHIYHLSPLKEHPMLFRSERVQQLYSEVANKTCFGSLEV